MPVANQLDEETVSNGYKVSKMATSDSKYLTPLVVNFLMKIVHYFCYIIGKKPF